MDKTSPENPTSSPVGREVRAGGGQLPAVLKPAIRRCAVANTGLARDPGRGEKGHPRGNQQVSGCLATIAQEITHIDSRDSPLTANSGGSGSTDLGCEFRLIFANDQSVFRWIPVWWNWKICRGWPSYNPARVIEHGTVAGANKAARPPIASKALTSLQVLTRHTSQVGAIP